MKALNPDAAATKDQKRRMFLTVPIEEGERWKFGQVTIEGNKIYTDEQLLRAFEHRGGGWLRSKVIDDGIKQIDDLYHNTGYIFARVEPELVEKDGPASPTWSSTSAKGDQFKVGRIEFQGNDRTKDKVLRRELRLYEGGLMNVSGHPQQRAQGQPARLLQAQRGRPGRDRHGHREEESQPGLQGRRGGPHRAAVRRRLERVRRLLRPVLRQHQELPRPRRAGGRLGPDRQLRDFFDLSYYIPWFLDKPQSIGIRAFDQSLDYGLVSDTERYLRDSRGAVLTYGRNFRLFQSVSMSYNNSIYNDETRVVVGQPAEGQALPDGVMPGDVLTQSCGSTTRRCARSTFSTAGTIPFEPTRGKRLSLAVEYAGGFLGGDNHFLRPELTFSIFQPVSNYPTKTLVALNVEAGLIDPFGKNELSPLERFFLGGENSIRGHRFRSIYLRRRQGAAAARLVQQRAGR